MMPRLPTEGDFERAGAAKKILVVDDEPLVLETLTELLGLSGFAVQVAGSAETAIDRLREESFDLVVTDFCMGGQQGDAVVVAARGTSPGTPVVVMTALAEQLPEWMRRGEQSLPILRKPFRLTDLLSALRSVMLGAPVDTVSAG